MVSAYFPLAAMGRNSICISACVQSVAATSLLQMHSHLLLKTFNVLFFSLFQRSHLWRMSYNLPKWKRKDWDRKFRQVKKQWFPTISEIRYLVFVPYIKNISRVTISRRIRLAGHAARMGRGEVHTRFWWRGRSEGRRPIRRPRRKWEDNTVKPA